MTRRLIASLYVVLAIPCVAQGIAGVTRRTTALEKQLPARQFFDAAGLNVTGSAPGAATPTTPGGAAMTRPAPLIVRRPAPSRGPVRAVQPQPRLLRPIWARGSIIKSQPVTATATNHVSR